MDQLRNVRFSSFIRLKSFGIASIHFTTFPLTLMIRYLKHIDTYPPAAAYISAFLTPSGARFLLLHQPPQLPNSSSSSGLGSSSLLGSSGNLARGSTSSIAANPTSPQTEEAVRQFMNEVYESYVKTAMSPFYKQGMEIRSPVFRTRVNAAGKKWL